MKLAEQNTAQFTALLASDAPAPGGGSAAALSGSIGAALTAMVCALTAEKPQYAQHQEEILAIRQRAEELRLQFLDVMDRDTQAFLAVSGAFALPKSTDQEKAARSAAIQAGLIQCTRTPLEMMALAAEALRLTAGLLGRFNENAASDLGVAALSLRSGLQGAWLNVLINVGSLKDRALARELREKGEALLAEALPLADQIYSTVLTLM